MRGNANARLRMLAGFGFIGFVILAPLLWAWVNSSPPRTWIPRETTVTVTVTKTYYTGAWWQPALDGYAHILVPILILIVILVIVAPIAPRRF